jgi:hypothetical protein
MVVPLAGEEVRVVQRGVDGALFGTFVRTTTASIVLQSQPTGDEVRVAFEAVSGISVQRGSRSAAWKGALVGLGLGLTAGLIVGRTDSATETGLAVGIGAGAGLPLGLLVGLAIREPEWRGVDLVGLMPR